MSFVANQAEVQTILAFVKPEKRERYVDFISNEKRRKEFAKDLAQFNDFDLRRIVRIPTGDQAPTGVQQILLAKGAKSTCHAISELRVLDGQELTLLTALKEVIGSDSGTLLCCIPGRLAYFENEDDRFILEHMTQQERT